MTAAGSDDAAATHVCPTCEQPLSEVRVKVTGVCPKHGITSAVCGNPDCWCVASVSAGERDSE